jgi:hypothetical protein
LALPALHAQVMHRTDVEWKVVRTTSGEAVGAAVDAIYAQRPDVVAATAWLFTHEHLLHIISRLKALLPQTVVILGGPEFLGDNEEYLRHHDEVDCLLRGEGEESFVRWLEVWDTPARWTDIEGMCYIYNGKYHDNGHARVMDFAALHTPEESTLFTWSKPFVQVETTRGCFNTCAFCVSGMGDPVRQLPLELIRRRLDNIRDRGIRDVRVLDRTFNFHPRHAIDLLNLFAEYHPHLRFHLEIHPALLSQGVRDVLREMPDGLLHLEAGIQSLRQEVLDKSLRKGTLEQALDGLRFLCSLPNLVTHADLIAGLPLYTLEQIYEDVHTLAEYRAGEIQLESLKLLPGTVMRRDAAMLGIRYSPLPPYEVLETDAITSNELQVARRLSRLLDAYYNTDAWQQITRRLILEERDFLCSFLDYLTYPVGTEVYHSAEVGVNVAVTVISPHRLSICERLNSLVAEHTSRTHECTELIRQSVIKLLMLGMIGNCSFESAEFVSDIVSVMRMDKIRTESATGEVIFVKSEVAVLALISKCQTESFSKFKRLVFIEPVKHRFEFYVKLHIHLLL